MPKDENPTSAETTTTTEATASSRKSGLGAGAITGIVVAGVAVLAATGFGGVAIGQTLAHNERPSFSRDAERGDDHQGQQRPGMERFGDRDGDGFDGKHDRDRDGGQGNWSPEGGQPGSGPMMPQGPGAPSQQIPSQTMPPQGTMPQGGLPGFNGWSGGS